jgi:hypothetical protein
VLNGRQRLHQPLHEQHTPPSVSHRPVEATPQYLRRY